MTFFPAGIRFFRETVGHFFFGVFRIREGSMEGPGGTASAVVAPEGNVNASATPAGPRPAGSVGREGRTGLRSCKNLIILSIGRLFTEELLLLAGALPPQHSNIAFYRLAYGSPPRSAFIYHKDLPGGRSPVAPPPPPRNLR